MRICDCVFLLESGMYGGLRACNPFPHAFRNVLKKGFPLRTANQKHRNCLNLDIISAHTS